MTSKLSPRPLSFKFFQFWFLIAILSAPVFLGAVRLWNFSAAAFILSFFFLCYWLSSIFPSKEPFWHRTDWDGWIVLYWICFLLSAVQTKIPYKTSVECFKLATITVAFFGTIHYCRDRSKIYRLCQVIILFGGFLSVVGLLQFLGGLPKEWWNEPHFLSSTYVNHNHFAGLLEIILPISLGLLVAERSRSRRILYVFLILVMGVAFVFTLSRGGIISLGIALIFMLFLLGRRGIIQNAGVPLVAFCVLMVGTVIIFGTHPLEERIQTMKNLDPHGDLSFYYRLLTWKGTLYLISRYLWFGSGPGTFEHLFLKFRPEAFPGRPVFAHNDYLQLLADCGFFVFVAALCLFFAILKRGVRTVLSEESRLRIGASSGASAALVALAVHSFFDFNFHIPANWMLAGVAAGLVAASGGRQFYSLRVSTARIVKISMAVFLLSLIGAGLFFGISDYFSWQAKKLFAEKEFKDALEAAEKGTHINPFDAEAYDSKGLIEVSLAHSEKEKNQEEGMFLKAVEDFDRAIRLNPYEPYYDFHKAKYMAETLQSGSLESLIPFYENALKKDPKNPTLYFLSGKGLLNSSKTRNPRLESASEKFFKDAIEMDTGFSESVYDLLWEHGYGISELFSFHETQTNGLGGFLKFLENHDFWKYHRGYFLQSLGVNEAVFKKSVEAVEWDENGAESRSFRGFVLGEEEPIDPLFYPGAKISKEVSIPGTLARLVLNAKGSLVGRSYPYLYVKIDGVPVDSIYLDSPEFKNFYSVFRTTPGRHRLSLQYANDTTDKKTGQGRDIWVKKMELQAPVVKV